MIDDESILLDLSRLALAGDPSAAREYVARLLAGAPRPDGSDAARRERLADVLLDHARGPHGVPSRAARRQAASANKQGTPRRASGVEMTDPPSTFPAFVSEPNPISGPFTSGWSPMEGRTGTDAENGMAAYVAVTRLKMLEGAAAPILGPSAADALESIVSERRHAAALRRCQIEPTRSVLLTGAPGVGKTMSAHYLASTLGLPLISVDLAVLMSSFLGQTGQNLRRALDVARGTPCVFLIDEIDALAKRRGDPSDVGELKRIVNVLLLELEQWPAHSLLVAATNHPELLDRAIWRRFDRLIRLAPPGPSARRLLVKRTLAAHAARVTPDALALVVAATAGASAADLCQLARQAVRSTVLAAVMAPESDAAGATNINGSARLDETISALAMRRLEREGQRNPDARAAFCSLALSHLGLTQREIARRLGISHVSVGRMARSWDAGRPSTRATTKKLTHG